MVVCLMYSYRINIHVLLCSMDDHEFYVIVRALQNWSHYLLPKEFISFTVTMKLLSTSILNT